MVSSNRPSDDLASGLREIVRPLAGPGDAMGSLLDMIGDARVVMIGEASHGTHEFYHYRAELTKRLIADRGFCAVCAEADWPDAWRVNRFVRNFADDGSAAEALGGFKRFPQWMWRNAVVLDFVNWLRARNERVEGTQPKAGFYGIDLYSLNQSIRAVLEYLDKIDHAAATRARYRYSCFGDFGEDPQAYGYAASFDLDRQCQDQVLAQLKEMQQKAFAYTNRDGRTADDEHFYAEQNARLVASAERYYRTMFEGSVPSWNLRDEHMADTIDALVRYMDEHCTGGKTKVVVWAHNSHLGDSRATEMSERGEWNVGQLVRPRWGGQACNIGFSTYAGTVTAANDWDGPAETMRVRPGMKGSWEETFHDVGAANFLLRTRDAQGSLLDALRSPRLERAIGVIYRPRSERLSHYFDARVGEQFDAMIHLDETTALIPMDRDAEASPRAMEETYPSGL
ncbi:MAG TPA: erythromycin esterase family protein [Tepidisphaeraceae bacterium]|nr:erythromycin esterase family protein [Tepidisphaeraceae bacterium]